MPTVSDMMVTAFETQPLSGLDSMLRSGPGAQSAEFLVVTATGRPLSLLPSQALETFGRTGNVPLLPTTPLVSGDLDFTAAARALGRELRDRSELAGAVVFGDGQVWGVLPRGLIVASATRGGYTTRGGGVIGGVVGGLAGNPLIPRPTFICPRCDYEEDVYFYDPSKPPRCPNHPTLLLLRKV